MQAFIAKLLLKELGSAVLHAVKQKLVGDDDDDDEDDNDQEKDHDEKDDDDASEAEGGSNKWDEFLRTGLEDAKEALSVDNLEMLKKLVDQIPVDENES